MAKRARKRVAPQPAQTPIGDLVEDARALAAGETIGTIDARKVQFWEQGLAFGEGMSLVPDFQRQQLLKALPAALPDLMAQLDKTTNTAEDQLVLTSLDIELKAAGMGWHDLANLLRWQIVAHRKATMRGVINATLQHKRAGERLTEWDRSFLQSLRNRNRLLSEKQAGCLQAISDSLDLSDDDFAAYAAERRRLSHREKFGDIESDYRPAGPVLRIEMG